MTIDDKLKQALQENGDFDSLPTNDGLLQNLIGAYSGSMKSWMLIGTLLALVATGFIIWTGYQFFVVASPDDQLFWGLCLVISLMLQMALKLWMWMEMNRNSLSREIKRLEIIIAKHMQSQNSQ